jgi:p-hydroxybenzoate 3-monooxygenase
VRAGLLEQNTVDLLRELSVDERVGREGLQHDGINLRWEGHTRHIAIRQMTGRQMTIYGQQEVVKDLIAALLQRGGAVHFQVDNVTVEQLDGARPQITYTIDGRAERLLCDFIAGCDGSHGVCRPSIPAACLTEYEFTYPFAWLGILAEAAPATDELIYGWHERGFALYSMRSPKISRLYIQVSEGEDIEQWPDERVWAELQTRLHSEGWSVNEGRVLEKGITPMRTFVCEPMQYGSLFLLGDAAHIVPATGAKGLNLAVNDARLLAAALTDWYGAGSCERLRCYSRNALRRVWRAQDFSNYMTQLLHDLGRGPFERRLQLARLEYIERSSAAAASLAENYAGLPAQEFF